MSTPLRVLVIEDSEDDARLLVNVLKKGDYAVAWERVETSEAMLAALQRQSWDVVVADFNLPRFSGERALAALQQSGFDLPLILVSGSVPEELAVDAMRAGARDFIVKERPARLVPAVQRELAETALRRERRALAGRLQQEQERFRALVEKSSEVILIIDADGRVAYESPTAERIFGFTAAERIGRHAFEHVDPADVALLQADFVELQRRPGAGRVREFRYRCKDGTMRWLEGIATNLLHDPSVHGFVANIRDITARKLAEQALEESRQRLQAVLDHSPALIFMKDVAGRYILTNRLFEQKFGRPGESLLGKTAHDLFSPDAADVRRAHDLTVISGGVPITVEETSDEPGGRRTYLSVKFPLRDAAGHLFGMGGIATDITERKALEVQFLHAQKMEAFGQLAGGIAHDFNNILTAILIQLDLLESQNNLPATVTEAMQELGEAARRAAALTRQLLVFSRRQPIQKRTFDLDELLTSLIRMLRRLLGERILLEFRAGGETLWINADPGMIEQVVVNLCVNARDAMPRGGRLTIATRRAERLPESSSGDAPSGPCVCLAVSDAGCGMDAATLKRIFEPFFTTKETGKGTGLGLATVYGIVKEHHGWIDVESQPGAGSTFRVYLPEVPAEPTVVIPAPARTGGNECILLVEDEAPLRDLAARCLRASGYRVFEAAHAVDARKTWEAARGAIDLLLTDQVMPGGTSGLELAQELCASNPALRAIVTTGHSDEARQILAAIGGNIRFLPKPFEAIQLLATVRAVIEQPPRPESPPSR